MRMAPSQNQIAPRVGTSRVYRVVALMPSPLPITDLLSE